MNESPVKTEPHDGHIAEIAEADMLSAGCDESVLTKHPSLSRTQNPVLILLRAGAASRQCAQRLLEQYSILPARIVSLLTMGAGRLVGCPAVHGELLRNIGEERGSRSNGMSHYELLTRCLRDELGIDVSVVTPSHGTGRFLEHLEVGLCNRSAGHVAGMLYALEHSATPELLIVGEVTNRYAALAGRPTPVDLAKLAEGRDLRVLYETSASDYSLEDFLAVHVLDFERGHRRLLWRALEGYLGVLTAAAVAEGFEDVLSAMDEWWREL